MALTARKTKIIKSFTVIGAIAIPGLRFFILCCAKFSESFEMWSCEVGAGPASKTAVIFYIENGR